MRRTSLIALTGMTVAALTFAASAEAGPLAKTLTFVNNSGQSASFVNINWFSFAH